VSWLSAGLIGTSLLAAAPALAQDRPARPGDSLAWMIGQWEGSGWMIDRERQRQTFDVFEEARLGSGGEAVILFGEGFSPAGAGRGGEPAHNATGLISRTSDGYEMRSVTIEGHSQDVAMTVTETGFSWSLSLGPQGRLNYEARHANGVWEETGAYCPPEGECHANFYMRLERVD
tara:strand:+ start:31723 stop:32247 length:525 start_codon:yes stop_codon:yes gene_type:complete